MAILRHIIEEAEKKSDQLIQEMRELIRSMTAAVHRQPNVSKDVKNALPQLKAIIDYLEEAKREKTRLGEENLGGIHSRVNPTKGETEIKAVRETRSGDVLIQIRKTTAQERQGFTVALWGALGESGSVRVLVPRTTLEISDMDSCTTVEEVELALRKKLNTYEGKLEVRPTRPNAVGQRMAVFSIEDEADARLLKSALICIGWISCRLRRREQVTRCYRYLSYGHESRAWMGPDRSMQCYRCGSAEHKVAD